VPKLPTLLLCAPTPGCYCEQWSRKLRKKCGVKLPYEDNKNWGNCLDVFNLEQHFWKLQCNKALQTTNLQSCKIFLVTRRRAASRTEFANTKAEVCQYKRTDEKLIWKWFRTEKKHTHCLQLLEGEHFILKLIL
jgi:hypothetical protein